MHSANRHHKFHYLQALECPSQIHFSRRVHRLSWPLADELALLRKVAERQDERFGGIKAQGESSLVQLILSQKQRKTSTR